VLEVVTLIKGVTNEFKFEIADTLRDPANSVAAFRVTILARGVTNEFKFEIAETLRDPTKPEVVLEVMMFARVAETLVVVRAFAL
jgi:hypothetical protein